MAKNITLMGADYPDVPAVQLPQTGGGTATFYDIEVIDNLNSDSSTDALSAKQGKILKESIAIKSYEDYEFTDIGFTAGTPGTRGNQYVYEPSKTPCAVCIVHIGDSSLMNPLAFISNGKVYLNAYRSVATQMTGNRATVRIFYDS